MADVLRDVDAYQKVDEVMRIVRSAVREAQAESRRLGVANVYSFNGQLYWELPNGEFTRTRPPSRNAAGRNQTPDLGGAAGGD